MCAVPMHDLTDLSSENILSRRRGRRAKAPSIIDEISRCQPTCENPDSRFQVCETWVYFQIQRVEKRYLKLF